MIVPKYKIKPSIFSIMSEMAQRENAINLSQGFPDFKVDKQLVDFVSRAMKDDWNQYAPMSGHSELKEGICRLIHNTYNISLNPNENILITAGATQAIFSVISALVNPGQKVLILDPSYDSYAPAVIANGGIPVHYQLTSPEYDVNWEDIEKLVDENTVLFIFNNPHNPTGHVFNAAFIEKLSELILSKPNLYLLSDEVYEHISFESFKSILQYEELFKKSFVVSSFGKTFHVTGWKLGYVTAPKNLCAIVKAAHQYMVFSVNSAMQKGVSDYIKFLNYEVNIKEMYLKKRNLFLERIQNSKFKAVPAKGTYFQLLDYSSVSGEIGDVEMAEILTKDYKVASIPISVFSESKQKTKLLRFCFAKGDDTIIKATEILCKI